MNDITIISAFNKKHDKSNKDYESCARRFVYSLRKNVGDIPVVLWYDQKLQPNIETFQFLNEFKNVDYIGGNITIPQPSKEGSWSSKLFAVRDIKAKTKYILWCDIDFYFLDDFRPYFEGPLSGVDVAFPPMNLVTNFGASPKEDKMWDQYYEYFGVRKTNKKIQTCVDKKIGNFYFTSSMMLYRTDIGFPVKYFHMASQIYHSNLPNNEKRYSQTCTPLLIDKYNWNYAVIPRFLSYMYHLNNYKLENDEQYPMIVHYADNRITEIPDNEWYV